MPRSSKTTTLEMFPVELFFELFKFFNTNELYQAFFDLNWRINSILSQAENKNTLSLVSEKDLKFFLEQSAESSNVVFSPLNIKSLKLHASLLSSKSGGNLPQFFSIYPLSAYNELHTLIITDIDIKCHTDADCTEFNALMSQAAQLKSLHTLELRSSTKNSAWILQHLINLIFEEKQCFLSLKRCRFDLEYDEYLYFQHLWGSPKLTKIEYLILPSILAFSFFELTACLPAMKSITVGDFTVDEDARQVRPRRTILPLCTSFTWFFPDTNSFQYIFDCFPNLEKLIIVTNRRDDVAFTGLQLEYILSRIFFKLKKFQLILHKLNAARTTFTGNFWLERKTALVYDKDNVTISFDISM